MHAHERTLLAKLGFADPDRCEPLHDLACQYLALPETRQRLIDYLDFAHGPKTDQHRGYDTEQTGLRSQRVTTHQVRTECEITKGSGQYQTTIGFADLALRLTIEVRCTDVRQRKIRSRNQNTIEWSEWQPVADDVYPIEKTIGVEVKVTPTSVSEIIRQVKLYRSYSRIQDWLVVTTYDLSAAEIQYLANEMIQHLRLGAKFDEYVAQRRAEAITRNVEI